MNKFIKKTGLAVLYPLEETIPVSPPKIASANFNF